jgi:hypothetical protein
MKGIKKEGSKPYHVGPGTLVHNDAGLVLYPVDEPARRKDESAGNEPNYPLTTEMHTGDYGSNPWREK